MSTKQKKEMNGRKGQSIIEYILMIAAVVAILIIFLGRGGVFERSYNNVVQMQGNDMYGMTNEIFF
jgi:hypothetical protein